VEILLCRSSAQKIGTDSGKKLQKKNKIKLKLNNTTSPADLPDRYFINANHYSVKKSAAILFKFDKAQGLTKTSTPLSPNLNLPIESYSCTSK